mmetsp:Transcript_38066/g.84775  ORF Transcript_38066/g.84775 Transcript_38066/m.84775 type:complete len:281 (+) Transcript_38066:50-892(+)
MIHDGIDTLTVSFKALKRARTTLEDFCCSYFPYHGLHSSTDLFRFLDVLVWLEASIYQLDELNESLASQGIQACERMLIAESVIPAVLSSEGLLDPRIQHELDEGDKYWHMERKLCASMQRAGCAKREGGSADFSLSDVLLTHEAKSFDYRLLHLVLHRLLQRPYHEALLSFLHVDELLVDIGDDLTDYEDDVEANSFNILRAYVHLFGRGAEIKLIERISDLERQHRQLLAALPPPLQEHYWRRHKEASHEEGSDRWVLPPLIYDEAAYRESLKQAAGA